MTQEWTQVRVKLDTAWNFSKKELSCYVRERITIDSRNVRRQENERQK